MDALAPKQKSAYKRSKRYKNKVGAYEGLRQFAEEVEASKARGQTSWTLDSFSSLRPVAKVADKDQDEEPDDDQEDDYEDEDPDDVEGADFEEEADSDEQGEDQNDEPEQDEEPECNEPAQSDSVNTHHAPSAKVQHTKRIATDEKRSVVNAGDARAQQRAAEAKRLARASDVQLAIIANKNGLGDMVKLDAKVRKELVSALVDVKLRELEAPSVLRDAEKVVDDIVKSNIANLKAFRAMQVPQNIVRLKFDIKDIAKTSTDEQFGRLYLEIARVLNSKSPQFFVNEAEVALGLLFEQYKKITKGEEKHQHARFHTITVGNLPEGMKKLTESYFKRRVLGDMVFAALHDTFYAFRHAKRGLSSWHDNYTKIFKALTSAGAEYDALRMKLLTAGGQAPNGADLIRLQAFKDLHGVDSKRARK